MKGIKPLNLGLLTRPFEMRREFRLGVSILAFFPLDRPDVLFSEIAMWKFLPNALEGDPVVDAGIPKSRAEFLVTGKACAPRGAAVATLPVKVRVGGVEKVLYVVGDRHWRRGVPSEPEPFTEMPVTWANAFGGEGFDQNPLGKGFTPAEDGTHALPNVEVPGAMIRSPKDRPPPASLGPLDFTWPQRASLHGTYDERWMKTRMPGFADDTDWRLWNLASPDQHQMGPFRGDEPILVENMHPERSRLESRLPGVRARCFMTVATPDGEVFKEVETQLTTVWLFPDALRGVLVFHASEAVREDDAADVEHVLIAAERLGEPRDREHYREVLAKRLDKERAAVESLRDSDLMPEGMDELDEELKEVTAKLEPEGLVRQNLKRNTEMKIAERRKFLEELDLDPDEHGPTAMPDEEAVPPLNQLGEFIERKQKEGEEQKEKLEAQSREREEGVEKLFEELGLDYEMIRKEHEWTQIGPPRFTADGQRARMRELADEAQEMGQPSPELEHYATDPELHAQWHQHELGLLQVYRMGAHLQQPAPRKTGEEAEAAREEIVRRAESGEGFADRDLTGADLSGLDLRGRDFSGALMESVDLENARLEGADFEGAVLANATLNGARLDGANLSGTNLGGARLIGVLADGVVDLSGANLTRAELTAAQLAGAKLDRAIFQETVLRQTDLSGVEAMGLAFLKTTFDGVSFRRADLSKCNFMQCDVSNVDFTDATLSEANFVECRGDGAVFLRARAEKMRLVMGCRFEGCDFKGAKLASANFRGSLLARSDFSGVEADGADFSECDLREARFYRARVRGGLMIRTDFRQALMVSVDLMDALMQKADLRGTDLRGANLFQADFARIRSDRGTNVTDANQKRVRVYPMRDT